MTWTAATAWPRLACSRYVLLGLAAWTVLGCQRAAGKSSDALQAVEDSAIVEPGHDVAADVAVGSTQTADAETLADAVSGEIDVAADVSADASPSAPVALCGVPTGTACPAGAVCCAQACPPPYPCVCEQGVACGWAPIAKAKKARYQAGSTFGGGKYWVFGGSSSAGPDFNEFSSQWQDGEVYDPKTDSWEEIPPAPIRPTMLPSVAWGGDRLYVYGKTQIDEELEVPSSYPYAAAWVPAQKKWLPLPKEGSPERCGFKPPMVWTGSALIVFGCKIESGKPGASYSPTTNKWTPIAPVPLPEEHMYFDEAVWTGQSIMSLALLKPPLVGSFETTIHTKLFEYAPKDNAWKAYDSQPTGAGPASDFATASFGAGIAVLGIEASAGPLSLYLHGTGQGSWQKVALPSWLGAACGNWSCHPVPRAIWTGKHLVLWNGHYEASFHGGALFEPSSMTFLPMPKVGEPETRLDYGGATNGPELFVSHGIVVGYPYGIPLSSGGRFLLPFTPGGAP